MKTLILAGQGFRSDVVKSILTVVALTLGMLGLVSVSAAQGVLSQAVVQRALAQGGPVATYAVTVVGTTDAAGLDLVRGQLAALAGAESSSSFADDDDVVLIDGAGGILEPLVRFAATDLWDVRGAHMVSGEWLTDDEFLAPRIVLNMAASKAVGETNSVSVLSDGVQRAAVIAGVVDDGETGARAYLSLGWLGEFTISGATTSTVLLSGHDLTESGIRAAATQLDDRGAGFDVSDLSRTDTVTQLQGELDATARVLFALGGLSLVASVTAVANLGLMTARSRSREYAMRRTLGASRTQIAVATVLESQMVGLLAAVVSAGLASLLFPLVIELFDVPAGIESPSFSPVWALLCVAVAAAASLVASLVPALMAFRRDTSSVMRE